MVCRSGMRVEVVGWVVGLEEEDNLRERETRLTGLSLPCAHPAAGFRESIVCASRGYNGVSFLSPASDTKRLLLRFLNETPSHYVSLLLSKCRKQPLQQQSTNSKHGSRQEDWKRHEARRAAPQVQAGQGAGQAPASYGHQEGREGRQRRGAEEGG